MIIMMPVPLKMMMMMTMNRSMKVSETQVFWLIFCLPLFVLDAM